MPKVEYNLTDYNLTEVCTRLLLQQWSSLRRLLQHCLTGQGLPQHWASRSKTGILIDSMISTALNGSCWSGREVPKIETPQLCTQSLFLLTHNVGELLNYRQSHNRGKLWIRPRESGQPQVMRRQWRFLQPVRLPSERVDISCSLVSDKATRAIDGHVLVARSGDSFYDRPERMMTKQLDRPGL